MRRHRIGVFFVSSHTLADSFDLRIIERSMLAPVCGHGVRFPSRGITLPSSQGRQNRVTFRFGEFNYHSVEPEFDAAISIRPRGVVTQL
jgi:hypothetical protein